VYVRSFPWSPLWLFFFFFCLFKVPLWIFPHGLSPSGLGCDFVFFFLAASLLFYNFGIGLPFFTFFMSWSNFYRDIEVLLLRVTFLAG